MISASSCAPPSTGCRSSKIGHHDQQIPKTWSRANRFRKGSLDNNLYIKVTQGNILLIEVYVDDNIFGSDDDRLSQKFAKDMQNEFEMSLLGELSFFLGLQIHQRNQGIFISQTKYIREMLKRFGMEDCKPVINPMQTSCKLSKFDDSKYIDKRQYRSMIGSLLYVTTSKPDVMQAVGQVAWFQSTPKESHALAAKSIFRYLKGIEEFGLWYPKGNDLSLIAYTDADWVGCIDDRWSTSGTKFYLGECLVSWLSKKQSSISLSTAEAEYIAAVACCTQVLWMKQNLTDIQVEWSDECTIIQSE
jgi:hypothetical protein